MTVPRPSCFAHDAPGPEGQHQDQDDEGEHHAVGRRVGEPVGLRQAEDHRADRRADDAAHAAHDHDDERGEQEPGVLARHHRKLDRADHAAQAGERGAEHEGHREDQVHVHARCREHAAVVDTGADHRAETCAVEQPPEQHADADAHDQKAGTVGRVGADDRDVADRSLEQFRGLHLVHLAGEGPQQQVGDHDRQADRHQRLAQVLALHAAQDQHLDQQADDRRGEHARGDREDPPAGPLGDDEADVAAQQVERAVREVDVAHQPEHEREAARDDEVERRERQPVEHREQVQARVVHKRPDREHEDRAADQQPEQPDRALAHRLRLPGSASSASTRSRAPWQTHRPSSRRGCVSGRAGSRGWRAGRRPPAAGRRGNLP